MQRWWGKDWNSQEKSIIRRWATKKRRCTIDIEVKSKMTPWEPISSTPSIHKKYCFKILTGQFKNFLHLHLLLKKTFKSLKILWKISIHKKYNTSEFCHYSIIYRHKNLMKEDKNRDKYEVIVPSFICPAAIKAIYLAGCKPVYVDIDDDFNISMKSMLGG